MATRDKYIRLTLSDSEKEAIEKAAKIRGTPAAEWARSEMVSKAWNVIEARANKGETK